MLFTRRKQVEDYYQHRINLLENELDQFEIIRENIKLISSNSACNFKILGIEQDKNLNWVIIYKLADEDSYYIFLKDCEKIHWDADFRILANKLGNGLHIGDIMGNKKHRGYGSILMRYLQELAVNDGIKLITGDLAPDDSEHLAKLKHFYSKHGFTVKVKDGYLSGDIEWKYFDIV
jgi:GNAT superfamily N-acetyltransferase